MDNRKAQTYNEISLSFDGLHSLKDKNCLIYAETLHVTVKAFEYNMKKVDKS
jgi:hypothetical protein